MITLDTPAIQYQKMSECIMKIHGARETAPNQEGTQALLDALSVRLYDLHTTMLGISPGLDCLPIYNRGIRLAEVLSDAMRETQPEAMQAWNWGSEITNETQHLYQMLQQVAFDLSMRVWAIEAEHSSHSADFTFERQTYLNNYELRKAIDTTE